MKDVVLLKATWLLIFDEVRVRPANGKITGFINVKPFIYFSKEVLGPFYTK